MPEAQNTEPRSGRGSDRTDRFPAEPICCTKLTGLGLLWPDLRARSCLSCARLTGLNLLACAGLTGPVLSFVRQAYGPELVCLCRAYGPGLVFRAPGLRARSCPSCARLTGLNLLACAGLTGPVLSFVRQAYGPGFRIICDDKTNARWRGAYTLLSKWRTRTSKWRKAG